jgi:hypothetical protein
MDSEDSDLDMEPEISPRDLNARLSGLNFEEDDAGEEIVEQLVERCQVLLNELERFKDYLVEHKRDGTVEYRNFRNELKSEVRFLKRLQNQRAKDDAERIRHNASSSNLPYYEALWAVAKRSREISKFRKWYFWEKTPPKAQRKAESKSLEPKAPSSVRKERSALVDLVADSGELWIKVSTVTTKRILFDLAKLGWVNDEDSDDENMIPLDEDSDAEDEVGVWKVAKNLLRAAKMNPIHARRPEILFVLPRIRSGAVKEVDMVVDRIRQLGITVICEQDMGPSPPLEKVLHRLLVDELKGFTPTVNVDCTILLALVSDISHQEVEKQPWHPRAVKRQIDVEKQSKLLPNTIYPVMAGRSLVCTFEAAERMQEITKTIGTPSENTRMDILLGQGSFASSPDLLAEWAKYSNHGSSIPGNIRLPVKIVSWDQEGGTSKLPPVARELGKQLTKINQSVFLYGWSSGLTTISSNGSVAHQIAKAVEEHRELEQSEDDDDPVFGPVIWLCPESRSLVAKTGRSDFQQGGKADEVIC